MITSINEQLMKLDKDTLFKISSRYDNEALLYKFSGSDFFEWIEDEVTKEPSLNYKKQVVAKSISEIEDVLPMLKGAKFLREHKRPYFVDNLENIVNTIKNGEKIAVEGGPCLFGVDEVKVDVKLKDGSIHTFDYSTGRRSDASVSLSILESELELYTFIEENAKDIIDISFIDNKNAATIDEYESIKILFDVSNALSCPFVMPIVDMSYQKYLSFATKEVDNEISEKAKEELKNIVHKISDIYIEVCKDLSKEYKNVKYLILHERDKELLDMYYEKRAPFIERKKVIHSLTDVPIRLEPIKDYCTMPALPYYFYDIKNILQVDCLDETDSHRKCKRAHRNTLTISALLYPEKIYDNGMTMFNSPLGEKKYIINKNHE